MILTGVREHPYIARGQGLWRADPLHALVALCRQAR